MIVEIKIPSPGESVNEVEIASWLVSDGDFVEKDQEIAEIESDKATLPLIAEESGVISIKAETGKPLSVGIVACTIDTEGKADRTRDTESDTDKGKKGQKSKSEEKPETEKASENVAKKELASGSQEQKELTAESVRPRETGKDKITEKAKISPLAKKLMEEEGLTLDDILKGLARITREDVSAIAGMSDKPDTSFFEKPDPVRDSERRKMSMLRRKLSQRLVSVKNETAMLTTFNEVDMTGIMDIRKRYQSAFMEKHGVKLGFMSFFTKAVTVALKIYPNVNSFIDGEDIVSPGYCDIGIAVQTDKGLMVPVIRNAEVLSLADIEKSIIKLAEKARKNRISIEDMTGGTFTITNGGIFGSLLSTPILNPPQSGILGMHNIADRPVAVDGNVVIRPMMYIALSYDHRIIDGRDSVGFLLKLKELLEDPSKMIFSGISPPDILLEL